MTTPVAARRPAPPDGYRWDAAPWGLVLRCEALEPVARHGWTTSDLPLRGGGPVERAGWSAVAAVAGVAVDRLVRMRQVHGATVYAASAAGWDSSTPAPEADAAIATDEGLALSVQVADCVPLLVADDRTGAVAAVHAGWRGTVANAAGATVAALARIGCRPADLVAALGPSIGPCCYEVGPDLEAVVRSAWPAHASRWLRRDPRLRMDVAAANVDQLVEAGLSRDRIHVAGLCTACHPALFPSYRRDGAGAGRLAGVIARRRPSPGSPGDPRRD